MTDAARLRAWLESWDLEALSRGEVDFSIIDPEATYEDEILPDHAGEIYRGHDGFVQAAQVWLAPYETIDLELDRVLSAGDCVVSVHRARGKARQTGIEFDEPLAWLFAFRDGRIIRWRAFRSANEALEAAGAGS
jgi:ketosteroid isomerase-like protein